MRITSLIRFFFEWLISIVYLFVSLLLLGTIEKQFEVFTVGRKI